MGFLPMYHSDSDCVLNYYAASKFKSSVLTRQLHVLVSVWLRVPYGKYWYCDVKRCRHGKYDAKQVN